MEGTDSHAVSSDEVDEMYCELCKTKNRSRTADGFCVDCVKYYCTNCLESHSDFLPNHVLKDKNSMPQDVCIKPCTKHASEIIKFYCPKCVKFFCSLCKKNDHSDCLNVSHLPGLVQGVDLTHQLNDVKEKLASNLRDVEKRGFDVNMKSLFSTECAEKAKAAVQSKKKEVLQWLDKNVLNIEKEIDAIQILDAKALDSEDTALTALKVRANTAKTDNDGKQLPTKRCELFMVLKDTENQQKQIEDTLKKIGQHTVTSYELKSANDLDKLLQKSVLGELARKEEATFSYTVGNISKKREILSRQFWVQKLPWQIKAIKEYSKESNQECFGFYLNCSRVSLKPWSCSVNAELTIINQKKDGDNWSYKLQERYSRDEPGWGFPQFLTWNKLLDPDAGFCKDDNIILQVHVIADPPQ